VVTLPSPQDVWLWLIEVFSGQNRIAAWFVVGVVVLYLPGMALYLGRRRRRVAAFRRRHTDAATVVIERSKVNDLLSVHSVDGQPPIMDGKGTRLVLHLTPGEHLLRVSYQWTESSLAAKLVGYQLTTYRTTAEAQDREIRVRAGFGGSHRLRWDHDNGEFQFLDASRDTSKTRAAHPV
jgi:hypothetical protein